MGRETYTIRRVEQVIMPVLSEYNFQLVDMEVIRGKNRAILRIYIDKTGGITVDELAQFNNRIGDMIDAEGIFDHSYTLEVSSPGLNRRIRYPVDFERYAGREIRIKTHKKIDGSNQVSGILLGMEGESVAVRKGDTKILVNPEDIDHANLIYDWGDSNGGKKRYGK
ncbi:MAG: ribosome maturation factor RimP [Deltaproteobacteria bacterium]|nr:ribosome maturation factor RimP [Deltaproteobacteria bacterium]